MPIIIAIFSLVGSTAAIMLVGGSDGLSGWIKWLVIGPVVFFTVFCMARVPRKEPKEGMASESKLVKVFEKAQKPAPAGK